jgi:Ca2+-binding EF-hand superfamily protein
MDPVLGHRGTSLGMEESWAVYRQSDEEVLAVFKAFDDDRDG